MNNFKITKEYNHLKLFININYTNQEGKLT